MLSLAHIPLAQPTDERPASADRRSVHPLGHGPARRENSAMLSSPARSPLARRGGGFTLFELMIVMVVVAILAMLAYPSYLDTVRKSRRSEAMSALMAVQQAQARWRGNHANYTTDLGDLGLAGETSSGYYTLSLAAAPAGAPLATAYVATAVGKDGTSQAADAQCRRLSVQLNGGNLSYAGCGACDSFSYTATHPCWAR